MRLIRIYFAECDPQDGSGYDKHGRERTQVREKRDKQAREKRDKEEQAEYSR
jgi:hypothetical protein